jgi:hypothetical protein
LPLNGIAPFGPLLLIILVLPISDELWIAYHFKEVCKDAGVHVSRKIEVKGFYDETMRSGYEILKQNEYKFMEHPSTVKGKIGHVVNVNGEWKETILDKPTARYHYKFSDKRQWFPVGFQLYKREMQIIDSKTGEIVSRNTAYARYPSLVEGIWVRFFGSGKRICSRPLDDKEKKTLTGSLTEHTFIPVK